MDEDLVVLVLIITRQRRYDRQWCQACISYYVVVYLTLFLYL